MASREKVGEVSGMKTLMLGLVFLAACGGDCIQPPCPFPIAVTLTVKSSTSGAPVNNVTVTIDDDGFTSGCNGVCLVSANPGKHHLKISAPGFRSSETDVTVTGTIPDCGCPRIDNQALTVSLTPE
jgi:hypothetical protein